MRPRYGEIERALLRLPRDGSPVPHSPPLQRGRAGPHIQPAFDLRHIVSMTGETLLMKERRDPANEQSFCLVIRSSQR